MNLTQTKENVVPVSGLSKTVILNGLKELAFETSQFPQASDYTEMEINSQSSLLVNPTGFIYLKDLL